MDDSSSRGKNFWFLLVFVIFIIFIGIIFFATRRRNLSINQSATVEPSPVAVLAQDNINKERADPILRDIKLTPNNYIGKTVTVNSEIKNVLDDNLLVLDSPGAEKTFDMLVITPSILDPNSEVEKFLFTERDFVKVVGRVIRYDSINVRAIEAELGGVQINDGLLSPYDDDLAIIASSIERSSE